MSRNETATALLDAAQRLIQARGYNAFSYRDLAQEVGIRTASIHYHFQTKADLGTALMERYRGELEGALDAIDRQGRSNRAKLKRFIDLYRDTESRQAICLCGSLASDRATLPETLRAAIAAYLDRSEAWVADKVLDGIEAGEFAFKGRPADAAAALLSSLQGGLILSRARSGGPLLDVVQKVFFGSLQNA